MRRVGAGGFACREIAGDELRVRIHHNPCPNVASASRSCLRRRDILLLGVNESPSLIDLYARGRKVAHMLIVIDHADFANVAQKLGDCVFAGLQKHVPIRRIRDLRSRSWHPFRNGR
jgi:hypothetical protein